MLDFVKEFQRRVRVIDAPAEVEAMRAPRPPAATQFKIRLYSLIKLQGGVRSRVGFHLTEDEAKSLAKVLTRNMVKSPDADESGGPLFEITLSEIRKED